MASRRFVLPAPFGPVATTGTGAKSSVLTFKKITPFSDPYPRGALMKAEIEVRYLSNDVDAVGVLRRLDAVGEVRRSSDGIIFSYDGAETTRAEILGALVRAGVRVTEYVQRGRDLEEIFLKVGATQVQ